MTEQKRSHARMMMRKEMKLICQKIVMLLILMLNG